MTAAPRTIPSEQNPEPASVWFCPFLDLYPEIAGTKNQPGVLLHGAEFNRGVLKCPTKVLKELTR